MNKNIESTNNLLKIQKTLENFRLPSWDELPPIYLYMDQVIELTSKYFGDMSHLMGEDKVLTPPMINNYIKLKAMPSPVKKRYGKTHLAYLLMISSLKQSINISSMKSVIPLSEDEDEIRKMYENFVSNQTQAMASLREIMKPIIEKAAQNNNTESNIMLQMILSASFMKIFTSGIIPQSEQTDEEDKKSKKNAKSKNAVSKQGSDSNESEG